MKIEKNTNKARVGEPARGIFQGENRSPSLLRSYGVPQSILCTAIACIMVC